jgi:hypothetical protein
LRGLARSLWSEEKTELPTELMRAIAESGVLDETLALAEEAAAKAAASVAAFADNTHGRILKNLPGFLLARKK